MKNILLIVLLTCAASAFAGRIDEENHFRQVFNVISANNVLNIDGKKFFADLEGLCFHKEASAAEEAAEGNVQCRNDADIKRLTVYGTADAAIESLTAIIQGAEKCEYIRKVLIKNFGRPSKATDDCNMKWAVKGVKGEARMMIGFQTVLAKNVSYFSVAREEQP